MHFERGDDSANIQTVDLSIGDCIRIGSQTLTVVDIDGQEVCFRVDAADQLISIARATQTDLVPGPSAPR